MKINKNTSFPQPVLNFRDDFKSPSSFQVSIETKLDEGKYYHKFQFSVNNDYIEKLINDGNAFFLIEIDCGNTLYREGFKKSFRDDLVILDATLLRDRYTIQVFICTEEVIEEYTSTYFNDDYIGAKISLDKSDIIGYWGEKSFFAKKDWDKQINISNFIRIRRSGRTDHTPEIDLNEDIIKVIISDNDFQRYLNLRAYDKETSPFFITEYVLPALIEALSSEELNSDKEWAKVLNKKIESSDELSRYNVNEMHYELSQAILNNPASHSLESLHTKLISLKSSDEDIFN